MTKFIMAALATLLLTVTVTEVHAKKNNITVYCDVDRICGYEDARRKVRTATAPTADWTSGWVETSIGARRPDGCPSMWCGCWLARKLGLNDRGLWVARNWAYIGTKLSGPEVGAVAVMTRGGGGHVGIIQGVEPNGNLIILSGNHNNRVDVGSYSRHRVIAYRMP